MRKRIAVIFDEDIYCQRGMFNAIRNRIKHLKDIADFDIDVYVIGCYEPWHIRKLRHTQKVEKVKSIVLDGIKYNTLWYNFSLIDYLLEVKFHKAPIFTKLFYRRLANKIHGYDLISAHSTNCGLVALRINERDGIPFCVTWHGSDIHTAPFNSDEVYRNVGKILNTASCNFFVSQKLREVGLSIAPDMKCEILYNGRNKQFYRYSDEERESLREKFGVLAGTKVVGFAGHFIEVKNPQLLAPIFATVKEKFNAPVVFWAIGSGKMQKEMEDECKNLGVNCKFWGSQPADEMPKFMNCMDVLVLPSRNEGLPLVVVEAIACGANAVGSDVGGTSEAIGNENVFPHGEDFVERISDRIVYMLSHHVEQPLSDVFEWENTANKELKVYKRLLSNG